MVLADPTNTTMQMVSQLGNAPAGGAGPATPVQLSHTTGTVNTLTCSTVDLYYRHDMSAGITIPAFTGTCTDGQKVAFRLKPASGAALGLTFTTGASKAFSNENGIPLPTLTLDSTQYVEHAFVYNATSDRFAYVGGTKATAPCGLADGCTGVALTDPNAHRLWGWDDTDNAIKFWTLGPSLTYNVPTDTLDLTPAQKTRTCMMVVGADNGTVLMNEDLGPQLHQCRADVAMTIKEIAVYADDGTPSVVVHSRTGITNTPVLSGALATAASGAVACARIPGTRVA